MIEYIFLFITGLVVGSFLNVCIYRLPKNISIVNPSSSCPSCNQQLKAWHNIPVLSYLFLRGRCHFCGAHISLRYPVVELVNAIFYISVFHRFGFTMYSLFYMVFVSAIVVITFIDLDFQIIPDRITLPGIIIGLISGIFFLPDPLSLNEQSLRFTSLGLKGSILGLLTGGGLFYFIAVVSKGGMGGGDIKMMAMVGASLGWKSALMTTFLGSLIGAVYGVGLMIIKGKGRKTRIPFGPFLSAGTIITLLHGKELLYIYLYGF